LLGNDLSSPLDVTAVDDHEQVPLGIKHVSSVQILRFEAVVLFTRPPLRPGQAPTVEMDFEVIYMGCHLSLRVRIAGSGARVDTLK
jgi:hypothetical protein